MFFVENNYLFKVEIQVQNAYEEGGCYCPYQQNVVERRTRNMQATYYVSQVQESNSCGPGRVRYNS